ncbi:MAG: ActD-like protein [Candidatus Latescibacterota bacterium]|jgi:hypothetical protein
MTPSKSRVSDLTLERYRLGELPEPQLRELRRALDEDAELCARLQALELSDAEIRQQYPPAWMARRIRLRAEAAPAASRRAAFRAAFPIERGWLLRLWPVPVAAVALLAVVPALLRPGPPESERTKGEVAGLQLFRRTVTGTEALVDSAAAGQGDLVQIVYRALGRQYGVILSVDGRGTVTVHLPGEGETAARLRQKGPDTLAFAYELDGTPGWERFYLVAADHPFPVATAVTAAQAASASTRGELVVPEGFSQDSFSLRKQDHGE